MLTDEPRNGANDGSEMIDETELAAASQPSSHEIVDVTTTDDNISATSTAPSTKAKKHGPGRRTKVTAETLENIRAGVAAGLPMEVAARRAGVGKTAFHNWRNDGELALDKQSKGQALSPRERRGLDVIIMLRDAVAERLAALQEKMDAEATKHRKATTTVTLNPVIFKGEVRRDEDGEFLMVPTVSMVTTEEADVRALTTLYDKAHDLMEKIADTATRTKSPEGTDGLTESLDQRLSWSIHVHKEQMYEDLEEEIDRRVNERLQTGGITAPNSAAARWGVTDDDDEYYEYLPWVSPYVPELDSGNSGNSGNSDSDPDT